MTTPKQIRRRGRWSLVVGMLFAILTFGAVMASADDVSNNLDSTVDATLENIPLTVGGADGSVQFHLAPTTGDDAKSGCNLTGTGSQLVLGIASDNTSVATLSASSVTITACDPYLSASINVHPVGAGTATVTLSFTSVTTSSNAHSAIDYDLAPATFTVNVTSPPPSDTTPPVIKKVITGTEGLNNWYTSNVTVAWTVTDPESAVVIDSGCGTQEFTSETTAVTSSCSAHSDGGSSSDSVALKIDKTGPSAVLSVTAGTPGANDWYTSDVTVSTSGSDSISSPVTCTADQQQTTDSSGAVFNGSCTNDAGLTTNAASLTVKRDATAPGITWNGGPADGSSYYFGSVPAAPTCTATDSLSGPDDCVVNGYSNAVGFHTLTATAHDKAGNTKVETRSYTVLAWTLKGFYQPVDMNGIFNTVKNGATVPLKFEIFAGQTELTDTADVMSLKSGAIACDATAPTDEVEATATGQTVLRYDTTAGQFVYNWQTPKTAGKCYRVTMTTLDGSSLSAYFKLK